MTRDGVIGIDTSVAVPLLVASHASHDEVASWAGVRPLAFAGHALIETYSVLTRLPGTARVAARDAVDLVTDGFEDALVPRPDRAVQVPAVLASAGVSGGATYDGLVAIAALDHKVPLATRDARARATYSAIGVEVLTLGDA